MGALRAFQISAKHLSFTKAAAEICVTQAAVSRRIASLEAFLGVALFERNRQRLELTEAGASYFAEIDTLLTEVEVATRKLLPRLTKSDGLTIAILPTLGARWLVPRLPGFLRENPDVRINFVVRVGIFNLVSEGVDGAFHFGHATWPDVRCDFLFREVVEPFCSPRLLESRGVLTTPEDLLGEMLLHTASYPTEWDDWFRKYGINGASNRSTLIFEQRAQLIQAVLAGIGVALIPRFLIESELETGALIPLFETSDDPYVPDKEPINYFYVTSNGANRPGVSDLFRRWVMTEAKKLSSGTLLDERDGWPLETGI